MTTTTVGEAERELAAADGVLAALIAAHGPCPVGSGRRVRGHFESLARSICYQQLAGTAAASIWARVRATVAGSFAPAGVLLAGEERLRAAGLSGAKARSILDLADQVEHGGVRLGSIGRRSDEEVTAELVGVWGVGPWTTHMFLIFQLGRLDVWPVGDLGVRAGYAAAWGLPATPSPAELAALGERFRPWRSVVAWYCWRALEPGGTD